MVRLAELTLAAGGAYHLDDAAGAVTGTARLAAVIAAAALRVTVFVPEGGLDTGVANGGGSGQR